MGNPARQQELFPDQDPAVQDAGLVLRESARAKRLSIKVYPRGRVEVIIPPRTSQRAVRAFVEEHRDWIANARARFAEELPPEPFRLPEQLDLPALSRRVTIDYQLRPGVATVRCREQGDRLVLSGATDDEAACVAALKRWLASTAKAALSPQLAQLAVLTGSSYRRVQVRGQRTCWGSHSSRGTISLNFCLLFLRPELVRYLLIHELCHAHHMNHSRRFWACVREFEPDYRTLDRELGESWRSVPAWLGIY